MCLVYPRNSENPKGKALSYICFLLEVRGHPYLVLPAVRIYCIMQVTVLYTVQFPLPGVLSKGLMVGKNDAYSYQGVRYPLVHTFTKKKKKVSAVPVAWCGMVRWWCWRHRCNYGSAGRLWRGRGIGRTRDGRRLAGLRDGTP